MSSVLINLRRVNEGDCRMIWEWNNNPDVRAISFLPDPIPFEDHVRWYEARRRDPGCFFYVATNCSGAPFGQIRFELTKNEGTVSVSLDQEARGKGYGSALILRGAERFFAESSASVIHAYIKKDNQASVRAFESAGFSDVGIVNSCEQRSRHFVLKRQSLCPLPS